MKIGRMVSLGVLLAVGIVLSMVEHSLPPLPLLLVSGAVMGVVTGTLMKVALPALKRISAQM